MTVTSSARERRVEELLDERTRANEAFFTTEAERVARLCHRCAERFARGGRLLAFGATPAARSDARHVAVEFVHPVIVGKRALPALALGPEGGPLAGQVELLAEADDIAVGFGAGDEVRAAVRAAAAAGCATIAFAEVGAEWEFLPPTADPSVAQELAETLYHVLWELVHVFFEHRGLLEGRAPEQRHDAGASSFLYPFLDEAEDDLDAVLDDVRRSVLDKAREVGELRARVLTESRGALLAAAAALRAVLEGGGRLLVAGNGGSATDAADLAADLRDPAPGWTPRPALDLSEDSSILTALANDVGAEVLFSRQVIAHGRAGDALVVISTSGGSANIVRALREARERGLVTVALVGYDGGVVLSEGLADHVIVAPSQHVPRLQEAQASAYHVLRELIEAAP